MIDPRKTVGQIATELPKAMRVFERYGIDYSCGGARTLVGVCSERDIPIERLVAEIESTSSPSLPSIKAAPRFDDLAALLDHIVSTHHTYARAELGRLVPLVDRVHREHAPRFGDLDRVKQVLHELEAELIPHMDKEEQTLFPYCLALEAASTAGAAMPHSEFGSLGRRLAEERFEHERIGRLLRELHVLVSPIPEDASEPVRSLYAGVAALERDLQEHTHLENNVALPTAEQLERELAS